MFLAVEQKTQNYAYAMWHGGGGSRTVAFVRSAEDKPNTLSYTRTHTHTHRRSQDTCESPFGVLIVVCKFLRMHKM